MRNYVETQSEPRERSCIVQRRPLCCLTRVVCLCSSFPGQQETFTELCCHSKECTLPNFRVKPVPHCQGSISSFRNEEDSNLREYESLSSEEPKLADKGARHASEPVYKSEE